MMEQDKTLLAQKKRRGPAPTGKGQQVVVRIQPDLLKALDEHIAASGTEQSRPEAIREILSERLKK